MFERFTDGARQAVVLAQDEARLVDHNYIGTEHLLLGLIRQEDGVAARVLASLGVSLEGARSQVRELVGQGQTAPGATVPFTPRAKKVLELSLREALQFGHDDIGTEHLLLGLVREGEGVGVQVLERLGVRLDEVQGEIAGRMGPPAVGGARAGTRGRGGRVPPGGSEEPTLTWLIERLDDGALEALAAARRSARGRGHGFVGARDLLAGVASVAGPGAEALSAVGLSATALADVDADADDAVGPRDASGGMPMTRAVRGALVRAVEHALRRGHAEAGTAHVLFGLLVAGRRDLEPVLDATGVSREDLIAEIGRRLDG